MPYTYGEIRVVDHMEIVGAEVRAFAHFSMAPATVALARVRIIAVRASDGATKAWEFTSLVRRLGTADPVNLETQPAPPPPFATAADETALAGVTISMSVRGGEAGVVATTPAGMTCIWYAKIGVDYLTNVP